MYNLGKLFIGMVGFSTILIIIGCTSMTAAGGECECSCKTNCLELDISEQVDLNIKD